MMQDHQFSLAKACPKGEVERRDLSLRRACLFQEERADEKCVFRCRPRQYFVCLCGGSDRKAHGVYPVGDSIYAHTADHFCNRNTGQPLGKAMGIVFTDLNGDTVILRNYYPLGYYPWGYAGYGFGLGYSGFGFGYSAFGYDPWGYGAFGVGFYYWPWGWSPGYYGYGGQGGGYGYGTSGYELGSLKLKVKPRDAEVFVDGYFAGTVDEFDGAFQRLHVVPGQHEIVVYLEGYRSIREKLYLGPNTSRAACRISPKRRRTSASGISFGAAYSCTCSQVASGSSASV